MNRLLTTLTGLFALVSVGVAYAHPGHGRGGGGHTPTHYLTEPLHVAGIVMLAAALIAVGCLAGALRRRHRSQSS